MVIHGDQRSKGLRSLLPLLASCVSLSACDLHDLHITSGYTPPTLVQIAPCGLAAAGEDSSTTQIQLGFALVADKPLNVSKYLSQANPDDAKRFIGVGTAAVSAALALPGRWTITLKDDEMRNVNSIAVLSDITNDKSDAARQDTSSVAPRIDSATFCAISEQSQFFAAGSGTPLENLIAGMDASPHSAYRYSISMISAGIARLDSRKPGRLEFDLELLVHLRRRSRRESDADATEIHAILSDRSDAVKSKIGHLLLSAYVTWLNDQGLSVHPANRIEK